LLFAEEREEEEEEEEEEEFNLDKEEAACGDLMEPAAVALVLSPVLSPVFSLVVASAWLVAAATTVFFVSVAVLK
jgi:hypothetical protein